MEEEPLEICELPQNALAIKCPSFLNIFIESTIFGRSKGSKDLCDGSKDRVQLVNMDCLEFDDNLATVTKNCRGESSCTVYSDAGITRNWTGRSECLDTELRRKDEFRVKYRCVECDYWPDTVATESCVRENLILNFWETEESLADLSEADLTGLLKEHLNKYLNGAAHNMVDLNFREVQGPDSSLCGMASMYRLLVNSFLTKSQLTQYDYSMMKNYLINATKHFATYYYTHYDNWKDKIRKNDPLLLDKIYKVLCGDHTYNPEGRRKRSVITGDVRQISKRSSETEEELLKRSYPSRLGYECGLARMFEDPELEDNDADKLYTQRWMQCNWNNTWSPVDSLDQCKWVACINPPQVRIQNRTFQNVIYNHSHFIQPPPETQLFSQYDGIPVEFGSNSSYVCDGDDLYFEWDRDLEDFNITCLEDGSWDVPDVWPICVNCEENNF